VAIADMFLKVQGVTGESTDPEHTGEIQVVSWSWGLQSPTEAITGRAAGRVVLSELHIVKRVDQSSPTLMSYLRNNRVVPTVRLAVRKAGDRPLTYFTIELQNAKVTSLKAESEGDELTERLSLGFSKVTVTYTPQSRTGGTGGGAVFFEADAHTGV
jgi:type VI secretion system secreted protein Hcp